MRLKRIRKLVRRFMLFLLTAFCIFIVGMIYFAVHCKSGITLPQVVSQGAEERKKITAGIKDYARPEEDAYLTYPEWYIVWSYQEKADFQEKHLPSGFPYLAAIKQYWSGYCCSYGLTRGRYPFNIGDHVMLAVIGSSFSGEYAVKGAYENTVGRFTEWLSSHEPVEEDKYAYQTARAYADFVHIRPFYEFSFWKRFRGLWSETRKPGPHPIRRWERKLFLSIDYATEAFYCWLIEKMTHASYGIEPPDTFAWIENAPEHPRVRRIRQTGPESYIVAMPRYQEFTTLAAELARAGAHFVEIAGNDQIALTVFIPRASTYDVKESTVLFTTDIPTRPELRRVAITCPVRSLHSVLNGLADRGIQIEHVYDY
jgi:hypothetical protein